jgi:AP-2 complex subunit sigma-1
VSYNLLDAAPEYLQEPKTSKAALHSLKKIDPNVPYHLPGLRLIEQYDPEDTSDAALSQPYAYVAANVVPIGDPNSKRILSLDLEDIIAKGPDLLPVGVVALARLRDFLAPGEKIGWWIVYNGDPERSFPKEEDEEEEAADDDDEHGEEESRDIIEAGTGEPSEEPIPGGAAALELLTVGINKQRVFLVIGLSC